MGSEIDENVRRAAVHVLAGRRVADFEGPRGWDRVATRLAEGVRGHGNARLAAEPAARDVAETEDLLLFYGEPGGFLMSDKSPRLTLGDWTEPGRAAADLLSGVDTLDRSGPYVAVLDPERFNAFWQAQASGCGYPASEQIKERIEDVYRSAVIRNGAVFSSRGSDFLISVGGPVCLLTPA